MTKGTRLDTYHHKSTGFPIPDHDASGFIPGKQADDVIDYLHERIRYGKRYTAMQYRNWSKRMRSVCFNGSQMYVNLMVGEPMLSVPWRRSCSPGGRRFTHVSWSTTMYAIKSWVGSIAKSLVTSPISLCST
jgi:hypothetical protein